MKMRKVTKHWPAPDRNMTNEEKVAHVYDFIYKFGDEILSNTSSTRRAVYKVKDKAEETSTVFDSQLQQVNTSLRNLRSIGLNLIRGAIPTQLISVFAVTEKSLSMAL